MGVSRRALFEQLDRPALVPLRRTRYEFAEWKPCHVNIDYHVEVAYHYYSVPYRSWCTRASRRASRRARSKSPPTAGASRRTCG
jgi:transposase